MMQTTRRIAVIVGPVVGVSTTRARMKPPQKFGGIVGSPNRTPHPYGWNASSSTPAQVPDSVVPSFVSVNVPSPVNAFGWTLNSPSPLMATVSPSADRATFGTSMTSWYRADSLLFSVATAGPGTNAARTATAATAK